MIKVSDINNINFNEIPIDDYWNTGDERELRMHRIHSYPAKFPAFITTKALAHFETLSGKRPKRVADIFCGCGTTAFESSRNNIDFWGCDINPVATLIAKVKSSKYQGIRINSYYAAIINNYNTEINLDHYSEANERLKYWYTKSQYNDLYHLRRAIYEMVPSRSKYRDFFLCAFSNILKTTSKWLTKSIKPQVDPNKIEIDVMSTFENQIGVMIAANKELDRQGSSDKSKSQIMTGNFLINNWEIPSIDLIISSPPYVTSYEYADLHQLSSLWLGYVDDYRDLREGTIGSLHHDYNFDKELKRLNVTGYKIVARLLDQHKSKAKSVAKYFLDMQQVAYKASSVLTDGGGVLFVIGNTEYKNVIINNAKHLIEALNDAGFSDIYITKRRISNKILTPYRDEKGKFTKYETGKKIYSEEFIVLGRK